MLGTVVNGASLIAAQLPGPSINGHNPDITPYPYDPEKAKALLAEAAADGVKVDTPVRFIGRVEQWDNVSEMAQVMVQMFNRVGFNMSLEMMERAREIEYQSKPYPEDVGPNLILISSDNNTGDAAISAYGNYHSEGTQSTTLSPEVDAMIIAAATASGEDRTTKYRELFRFLHDDVVASVPLFYMVGVTRVSERLDWIPTIASNSQIEVQNIKFAE
jgi:peptide/nickel transport system substrate-binding protein